MPDYQQGRIYCIRAPGTDEIYIGSTTQPLSKRMAQHRNDFNRWKSEKTTYTTSYKLLELEGAYIELIEEYPCDSKEELNRREGEMVRANPNCVNKQIAGRDHKEYMKQYYEKTKEKQKEQRKQRKQLTSSQTASPEASVAAAEALALPVVSAAVS